MSFVTNPFRFAAGGGDPHWGNVKLLLGFESGVADESSFGNDFSIVSDAAVSSAQAKFGSQSLLCDGTTGLSRGSDADFDVAANTPFCWEA